MHDIARRVYDTDGISPTIHTMGGGNLEPKILEPCIGSIRGRNPDNPKSRKGGEATQQMLEIKTDGTSNTLTTVQKDNVVLENCRIRKLTPLECWRLMGFDDADHEKSEQAGVSNSQRYKQAGNSIVVNVLEAIFKQML